MDIKYMDQLQIILKIGYYLGIDCKERFVLD